MLLMGSVVEGASLAAKECQEQFKNEKWNCSSFSHKSAALGLMTKSCKYEPRTQDICLLYSWSETLVGKLARCGEYDKPIKSCILVSSLKECLAQQLQVCNVNKNAAIGLVF